MEIKRHPALVHREKVGLLIIDIQNRVNQVVQAPSAVLQNTLKLIKGFQILQRPIWVTEQYPQGLGPTNTEILAALPPTVTPRAKIDFSCCGDALLLDELSQQHISQLVLTGVESHVCVFQSAMDLHANGFQVFLPVDAVSSRREQDWRTAMERASRVGIITTTTEAVLFEMLARAGSDEFRAISKIVK
ncbi:isochorismatase family protein [candidate division KSB1 bacterium]|nr:isochorismatase family protein [candidate division KSB1 bacterium]